MGFKNLDSSEPCNVTSLVLRSVKKNPKNLKTCIFLESTCQVHQEKYKNHVLRYKYKIDIQSYKILTKKDVKTICFQNFVKKFEPVVLIRSYFPLPCCFV